MHTSTTVFQLLGVGVGGIIKNEKYSCFEINLNQGAFYCEQFCLMFISVRFIRVRLVTSLSFGGTLKETKSLSSHIVERRTSASIKLRFLIAKKSH